jgi:uncharacterized protein (DUF58 family)
LPVYAGLAGLALLAGLAFGRPELTVLALPFLAAILAGSLGARPRELHVSLALDQAQLLEGEEAMVEVALGASEPLPGLEATLHLDPGLRLSRGPVATASLLAGSEKTLQLAIDCLRWGRYDVGRLRLRWPGPLGLFNQEGGHDQPLPLRVYPRPERLRSLVRPADTQVYAGNQVARARGDGIEFAEIRPYAPGDRLRHVNWRATGRRGSLQVNDLHPERNSDVILFLDTFGSFFASGERTIDLTLRAAIGLAEGYLRQRDRVGAIAFGGMLRWLSPGMGMRQRYQLVEALLDTRIEVSYAWKRISTIPARTLPPRALILALTPLVDERFQVALDELVGRGFDLAICELELPWRPAPREATDRLAQRVFALRRDSVRARYARRGVAIVTWTERRPFEQVIEEVRIFRRHARHRSA